MAMMRLDKFLCEAAGITRSEAKKALSGKQVTVNGVLCRSGDSKVDDTAEVRWNGTLLHHESFVYLMLHKPKGVVSASSDNRDVTVVDLVKRDFPRRELFPAGRLDKDSEGFILLTDDGAFAHDILSPRHHVSKTYLVGIDIPLTAEMQKGFAEGVTLADGQTMQPAQLDILEPCLAKVVLSQGVYHQIKRMFGVFGAGVTSLKRIAIGGVFLDEALSEGEYRRLTQEELKKITGKY